MEGRLSNPTLGLLPGMPAKGEDWAGPPEVAAGPSCGEGGPGRAGGCPANGDGFGAPAFRVGHKRRGELAHGARKQTVSRPTQSTLITAPQVTACSLKSNRKAPETPL